MSEKKLQEKIQELQLIEQNLQNFSLQKQAFQIELNETTSALDETKKSKGDIYKIIGQVMLKANKENIINELEEKKKILELRINSIAKQEALLQKRGEEIKKELEKKLKVRKK